MMSIFYIICGVSLIFFTMFFVQCCRLERRRRKPVIHKLLQAETSDAAAEQRWLDQIEKEMAEFVSHQR